MSRLSEMGGDSLRWLLASPKVACNKFRKRSFLGKALNTQNALYNLLCLQYHKCKPGFHCDKSKNTDISQFATIVQQQIHAEFVPLMLMFKSVFMLQ